MSKYLAVPRFRKWKRGDEVPDDIAKRYPHIVSDERPEERSAQQPGPAEEPATPEPGGEE